MIIVNTLIVILFNFAGLNRITLNVLIYITLVYVRLLAISGLGTKLLNL